MVHFESQCMTFLELELHAVLKENRPLHLSDAQNSTQCCDDDTVVISFHCQNWDVSRLMLTSICWHQQLSVPSKCKVIPERSLQFLTLFDTVGGPPFAVQRSIMVPNVTSRWRWTHWHDSYPRVPLGRPFPVWTDAEQGWSQRRYAWYRRFGDSVL